MQNFDLSALNLLVSLFATIASISSIVVALYVRSVIAPIAGKLDLLEDRIRGHAKRLDKTESDVDNVRAETVSQGACLAHLEGRMDANSRKNRD